MATTNHNTEERVEVFIPKGLANDDPNFYISINDVDYLLPKGQTSLVPPHVKAGIERHFKAVAYQEKRSNSLVEKTLKPTNM